MAVTLFHKRKVINNIIIRNGVKNKNEKQEENKSIPTQDIKAKIKGKMYGRRTINR